MNTIAIIQIGFDIFIYLLAGIVCCFLLKFNPESEIEYKGKSRLEFNLTVRGLRLIAIVLFPFMLFIELKTIFATDYYALRQELEVNKLTVSKIEKMVNEKK